MKKYLTVFQLSFQNEFTYRLNFILWRVRNVIRILMVYFLWKTVFLQNTIAFEFTREQMMTYVFLVLIVTTFVMAAPSNDNVGGEISNGDLSNFLVKPINYLTYWLTRDWASKLLNTMFSVFEIALLWIWLRPTLYWPHSFFNLIMTGILLVLAAAIYFVLTKIAIAITFWTPENTWGLMFLILVFVEVLSGTLFPLSILSKTTFNLLQLTPFPYLVYFPVSVWLGRLDAPTVWLVVSRSFIYFIFLSLVLNWLWKKGLKEYSAVGK